MVTGLSWWLLIIYKVGGSSNFQVSDQEGRGGFHPFQHHLCRFGIPKVIITDNAANVNSHLMQEVCYQFKIEHRNSTPYRSKANRTVEAANKNIKKILRKMVQIIPTKIEIPSLGIVVEAEIDGDEWTKAELEQLSLIDEKRLPSICHGQLYHKRMARAYNKKVRPTHFEEGQLVLRHILPHHAKIKGKFSPNWRGPFAVKRVLPNGALYLADIESKVTETIVNADVVKRYYI
ncbi:uncharacterized protein [Solanum lycopersicum]|uniref:uncharacterized protein n=1 Tax=Solanum lycopersicum TaxID=4081 RepID=UPI0002BCB3DA|nr:uncharacterized protein LOC101263307 [Solanum lycopersicum]